MNKKKAVCLISGGLDSCVVAYIAKKLDYEIYSLSFNYSQQHDKELKFAKKISSEIKSKNHIIFNLDINVFGGSSLFKGKFKNQKKKIVRYWEKYSFNLCTIQKYYLFINCPCLC